MSSYETRDDVISSRNELMRRYHLLRHERNALQSEVDRLTEIVNITHNRMVNITAEMAKCVEQTTRTQ